MMEPKISIIIPCYNSSPYIDRAFDCLRSQTFRDFEMIFVDDGSTDDTGVRLEGFKGEFDSDRVVIIHQENAGQSAARNVGFLHATGEYVIFFDSDDYVDSDYLETLYTAGKAADSDMILSGQKKVDENGRVIASIDYPVDIYPDYVLRRLNPHGKMYRRSFLEKHQIRFAQGKLYEDNAFNLKAMFLCHNQVILPYNGHYQVMHTGSTMTRKIEEDKVPYEALEEAIEYVLSHPQDLTDYSIFEFTVLSFMTYFIFQANRRHIYAAEKLKGRKSDMQLIEHICDYTQRMIPEHFPEYWKNPHVGIWKHRYLSLSQRAGVWLFTRLLKTEKLKMFAKLIYQF